MPPVGIAPAPAVAPRLPAAHSRALNSVVLALAAIVLISTILHLAITADTSGARIDFEAYLIQADTIFHHENV
jgi:hypothetical protein